MILKCIYSYFVLKFGNILFLFSRKMGNFASNDGAFASDDYSNYPIAHVVKDGINDTHLVVAHRVDPEQNSEYAIARVVTDGNAVPLADRDDNKLTNEEENLLRRLRQTNEKERESEKKLGYIKAMFTLPRLPEVPSNNPSNNGRDSGSSGNGGGGGTCVPVECIAIPISEHKNRR